jgi:hypothetical protein
LDGYFQSYKYFQDIREVLLRDFFFPGLDENNSLIENSIVKSINSVSIHFRRSDYLMEKVIDVHGVLSEEYYSTAVNLINKIVPNSHFFIFSDDIKHVKDNYSFENATFIEGNNGTDSWKDLYLMSKCKNNIIANSTFSWWAGWLNINPSKIVIAPKKWFNNKDLNNDNLIPQNWIQI